MACLATPRTLVLPGAARTLTSAAPLLLWQHGMDTKQASGNSSSSSAEGSLTASTAAVTAPLPNGKRRRLQQCLLAPVTAAADGALNLATATTTSNPQRRDQQQPRKQQQRSRAVYKEPGPGTIPLGGGAAVEYRTDLLRAAEAAQLLDHLRREVRWEQRNVCVMGRTVPQPRLVAYMADGPELSYTYSGTTLGAAPWHPTVAALKARVEAAVGPGATFNSCLLNYYRSGKDCIGWHSDNEALYGSSPTIASVSLGGPREFVLRRNADHADKYRFWLGGGALLVMSGSVQEQWMHSIPRREQLAGERISLTFRRVLFPERAR